VALVSCQLRPAPEFRRQKSRSLGSLRSLGMTSLGENQKSRRLML